LNSGSAIGRQGSARNTKDRSLLKRIEALGNDPRPAGCEKLPGRDLYRMRQGVYRIVYSVDDAAVVIEGIKVGHRREVYRTPCSPRHISVLVLATYLQTVPDMYRKW
jgi:mRNA interferase RelE/StbE